MPGAGQRGGERRSLPVVVVAAADTETAAAPTTFVVGTGLVIATAGSGATRRFFDFGCSTLTVVVVGTASCIAEMPEAGMVGRTTEAGSIATGTAPFGAFRVPPILGDATDFDPFTWGGRVTGAATGVGAILCFGAVTGAKRLFGLHASMAERSRQVPISASPNDKIEM